MWNSTEPRRTDGGFGLVEVLVATLVLSIGMVSMVQLLAVTTVMYTDAREVSMGTEQAQAKIDELMKLNLATDAQVQISADDDTLTENVTNYFDTPGRGITRRWHVDAGPTADTRIVTVRVVNARARQYGARIDLTTIIRQW